MDKNTLSNYGWIVIAVLVLSVMIALATPFGKYIENGVRSTTAGLFDTSEKAMNVVGMSAGSGNFEDGYTGDFDKSETVIGFATFDACFGDDSRWQILDEPITLSWDELQLAENGTKYDYDASKISDTDIGDYAFEDCHNLTSITIPDSVTSIGYSVFKNCSGITSITIPDGVTSISRTFDNCYNLTSVTIPDSVTSIGYGTFYNCYNLDAITIPDSVTTIGDYAFNRCTALTAITFGGIKAQWNAITFGIYALPATVVQCTDGNITL